MLMILGVRCALKIGFVSECVVVAYVGYLLFKYFSKNSIEEAAQAEKQLWEHMWSSIALVVFCLLFAYFHFYLLYLPFSIVFYLHLRVLLPITALVYPFVILVMPNYVGMSLSSMLDPLINPTEKSKTS